MLNRRQLIQNIISLIPLLSLSPSLRASSLSSESSRLLKNPIPSTDEILPAIGLNTDKNFNVGLDDQSLHPLKILIEALFDNGGTLIDVPKEQGNTENVIQSLLLRTNNREKSFISVHAPADDIQKNQKYLFKSLHAFKTQTIDLLQVHQTTNLSKQLHWLYRMKQQELTRYTGLILQKGLNEPNLFKTLDKYSVDFVQIEYSLNDRKAEQYLLPYCLDNGIAVLVTGSLGKEKLLPHVLNEPLPNWAIEIDATSWVQLLTKFILSTPGVTSVLSNASEPFYIVEAIKSGMGRLPDDVIRKKIQKSFS